MKNFRIADGDLVISNSRRIDMVLGRDKLIQDLTMWLLEPLGAGYMTPGFGSTLNTVISRDALGRQAGRYIGQQMSDRIIAEVEAEIDRVLNNYQQAQVNTIRQAQIDGRLYLYSLREILNSIDSITSKVDGDRAIVQAAITTGANQGLTFLAQVDEEEASVSAT